MWPVLSSSFTVEVRPPHDSPPNFKLLTSHLLSFFLLLYLHQNMPPTQNNQTLPSFRLVSSSAPLLFMVSCKSGQHIFPEPYSFCSQKTTCPEMTATALPNIQVSCNFYPSSVVRRPMLNVNPSLIPGSSYWEHMVRYPFGPRCFSRNWSIDFGEADQHLVHCSSDCFLFFFFGLQDSLSIIIRKLKLIKERLFGARSTIASATAGV